MRLPGVKITFCFTGAVGVLQGAVVQKTFYCIISLLFTSEFKFRTNPPRLCYLNPALNNPAQELLKSEQF